MRKYRLVAKKGEGTFSEVLKAQNIKDGKYHAIKCMKNRFENIDQVNNLREIQALRRLSPHEHVITLEEVLYDQPTGRLALVFELMDGNLYEIIRGRRHYLNAQLIKGYMWQLMKSLDHMHKKGIFHRDIKPENILVESTAEIGHGLKLADFGSCRGIYSKQPYTEYISTRWYRAPECLLTDGYYGPEMDMWGAGCVMFEITTLFPLFPGKDETDQIARIHKIIGTRPEAIDKLKAKGASHISFDFPTEKGTGIVEHLQHASPEAVDLMLRLLKYDSSERISARDAMRHAYFKEYRELEAKRQQALQQQQAAAQAAAAEAAAAAANAGGSDNNAAHAAPAAAPSKITSKYASPEHAQQATQSKQQQQKYSLAPIPVPNNSNSTSNKGLPNIVYGNAADGGHQQQQQQYQQQQQQQQQAHFQQVAKHYNTAGASGNMAASGAMMSTGGSAVSNTTGSHNVSSLPPIAGGGGAAAKGSSKHHHKAEGGAGTQRRRKKYRLNYATQDTKNTQRDTNQVLRAYGLQNHGAGGSVASNNGSVSGNGSYVLSGNAGGGGSMYQQGGNSKGYGGGGGGYMAGKKY